MAKSSRKRVRLRKDLPRPGAPRKDLEPGAAQKDLEPGAPRKDLELGAAQKDLEPGAAQKDLPEPRGGRVGNRLAAAFQTFREGRGREAADLYHDIVKGLISNRNQIP